MSDTLDTLRTRFDGASGKQALIRALESQKLIAGDEAAAKWLSTNGKVVFFNIGDDLIGQGAYHDSVYFILAGEAAILLHNNQHQFTRGHGEHVGEMAAIDPQCPRSATVRTIQHIIALELTSATFLAFLEKFPKAAIATCKTLADRLRERDNYFRPVNHSPKIFVISTTEDKVIAQSIQEQIKSLLPDVEVQLWYSDNTFRPSTFTMPSLVSALNSSDFAVAIGSPIDEITSRKENYFGPRDNVILEYGMAVTAIGLERSFFMMPEVKLKAAIPTKTASDLSGLNFLMYEHTKPFEDLHIGLAMKRMAERVHDLGPLQTLIPYNKR